LTSMLLTTEAMANSSVHIRPRCICKGCARAARKEGETKSKRRGD
jgi:hypothetical protein